MKRPKVLIADDDRGVRSALRMRLSIWGYSVVELEDGLGVLGSVAASQPQAVILDHQMPNGDGRSVARIVRRECDAPIIFLSGRGAEEFREEVFELRDVYYLAKPLEPQRLRDLLESCITKRCCLAAAG